MAVKDAIPSIPPVPAGLDQQTRVFLQALRDAVTVRFGQTKNTLDYSPTLRDLIDNGIIDAKSVISNSYGANWQLVLDGDADETDELETTTQKTFLPWIEQFSDNNLTRVQADWGAVADIGGEEAIYNETVTPPDMGSTLVYQLGDNTALGDDEVSRVYSRAYAIPIEQNVLYRMTVHFRRVSGTGTCNFGIAGLAADKETYVNASGADSVASQHYFVANAYSPGSTAWETAIGYFMQRGASATSAAAPNPLEPGIIHADAKYMLPIFYTNVDNATGKYQIAYMSIENALTAAGGSISISDILTDTVIASGTLVNSVSVKEGTIYRAAAKGVALGTCYDGDAVTFSPAWSEIPTIHFGAGGIAYYEDSFKSSQQTLAATGSVAHGLGAIPDDFQVVLVCLNSNKGFSTGDEVEIAAGHNSGNEAFAVWADGTSVGWSFGNTTIYVQNKTSASWTAIDSATPDWAVVVKAKRYITRAVSHSAENLTTSGFTARCKLKELAGTTTLVTNSTVSDPSSPSGLAYSINKGAAAEAYDDNYTFQFDVTVQNFYEGEMGGYMPGQVNVGLYTNTGGAGWVLRKTVSFYGSTGASSTTYSNQTSTINVDGLGVNDDFGINIDYDLFGSGSITFDNVTHYTATAPNSISATPTGATPVGFMVLA